MDPLRAHGYSLDGGSPRNTLRGVTVTRGRGPRWLRWGLRAVCARVWGPILLEAGSLKINPPRRSGHCTAEVHLTPKKCPPVKGKLRPFLFWASWVLIW